MCVYVFVLFIYTISISICVSQEEPSLTGFNQQIYDFYRGIVFEKKIHCIVESKILISVNYSFNHLM